MDGLIAFLRARLDEDEVVAQVAVSEHEREFHIVACDAGAQWVRRYGDYGGTEVVDGAGHVVVSVAHDKGAALRTHIARHDPARALREVEAKRQILRKHNVPSVVTPGFGTREDDRRCVGCGFGSDEEPLAPDVDDCPILRALAAVYANHPDYRTEWAP
jgi:hypothetical protein